MRTDMHQAGIPRRGHLRSAGARDGGACPAAPSAGSPGESGATWRATSRAPKYADDRHPARVRAARRPRGLSRRPPGATTCGCWWPTRAVSAHPLRSAGRVPRRLAISWWSTRQGRCPPRWTARAADGHGSPSISPPRLTTATGSSRCDPPGGRPGRSAICREGETLTLPMASASSRAGPIPSRQTRLWRAQVGVEGGVAGVSGAFRTSDSLSLCAWKVFRSPSTRPCSPASKVARRCRAPLARSRPSSSPIW